MTNSRSHRPEEAAEIAVFTPGRDILLLLEDNECIARMVGLVLRGMGLQIVWCPTGADALAQHARHAGRVALILADCRLPDMDGREVCRQLRLREPDLPVLVTSGNVALRGLAPLEEAPLVGFLPKPYSPAEIISRVRGLLLAARAAA
ncbi:MAG: response regulator transcription factor [Opitutales bacterium]